MGIALAVLSRIRVRMMIFILICALWVCATSDIKDIRDMALAMFTSITQGVLTAGADVYINQLYKQSKKKD